MCTYLILYSSEFASCVYYLKIYSNLTRCTYTTLSEVSPLFNYLAMNEIVS